MTNPNLEITPYFNHCYNHTKRVAQKTAIEYYELLRLDTLQREDKLVELHRQSDLLTKESEALNRQEYLNNAEDSEFLYRYFNTHIEMQNDAEQQKLQQALTLSKKKYWLQYLIVETQITTDIQELQTLELAAQKNGQCLSSEQKDRLKFLLAEHEMIRSNYSWHLLNDAEALSLKDKKKVSFGYLKPQNFLFSYMERLNEEIGFLMPQTSIERFIQIITCSDLESVHEKIYLGCKTNEFKYVLTYLSDFFDSLSFANIGRSGLFISNLGTPITATNLTSANYDKMLTKPVIDRIFR